MRNKGVTIRVILAVTLLYSVSVTAQDHVVSSAEVAARLATATAERQANLAVVDELVASPAASRTASLLGMDASQVKLRLARLSDAEARDLAARARALRVDPVGAWSSKGLLITVLVIIGSWLLLLALLRYGGG